jgi:hypothetical protein
MSDDVERYLSNLRTEAANMGEAGKDREQELLIKEIGRLAFDIRGTSEIIRQRLLYFSQHVAVQSPEKHQALSKVYASWASDVPPAPLPDPPASACSLLDRLLPRSDRNVIRGDVEEEFKARLVKHGPTHARRWFR